MRERNLVLFVSAVSAVVIGAAALLVWTTPTVASEQLFARECGDCHAVSEFSFLRTEANPFAFMDSIFRTHNGPSSAADQVLLAEFLVGKSK
jgi:hypothetical protein